MLILSIAFQVIVACDLKKDIFSFPKCDATLLGDRVTSFRFLHLFQRLFQGYILNATQKAQISLARCLYEVLLPNRKFQINLTFQDAEIYALDKAFATMDRATSRKVFERVWYVSEVIILSV